MINFKELRIGNWVYEAGEFSFIYQIGSGGISFCKINDINVSKKTGLVQTTDEDRFSGIPLDEGILKMCGGKKVSFTQWIIGAFVLTDIEEDGFLFSKKDEFGVIAKIKHLHQLQNLYYALTSTELSINLTEKQTS